MSDCNESRLFDWVSLVSDGIRVMVTVSSVYILLVITVPHGAGWCVVITIT